MVIVKVFTKHSLTIIMCNAVCYVINGKVVIVDFAQVNAMLPVIGKNKDQIIQVPWGRRKKEHGKLPLGGWASQESINNGKWDKYFPKKVKIPLIKFQESDFERDNNWFDVTAGQWIQGIFVQENEEKRVYIITLTPERSYSTYTRWPVIVNN